MLNRRTIKLVAINGELVERVAGKHQRGPRAKRRLSPTGQGEETHTRLVCAQPSATDINDREPSLNDIGTCPAPIGGNLSPLGAIKGFFQPPKGLERGIGAGDGSHRPECPYGGDPNARGLRDGLDGSAIGSNAVQDGADSLIEFAHAHEYIRNSEALKGHIRTGEQDIGFPNGYADVMSDQGEERLDLGGRVRAAIKKHIEVTSCTQAQFAKAAGEAVGTISHLLTQKITPRTGKPLKTTLGHVIGVARASKIPMWAFIHEDQQIFDYYLQRIGSKAPDDSFATAMALARSTSHRDDAATAAWLDELEKLSSDGRSKPAQRKTRSAPKKRVG